MWRNILGQTFYQLVFFMTFLFLIPADIIHYPFIHEAEDGVFLTPAYWGKKDNGEPLDKYFYQKCTIEQNPNGDPIYGDSTTRWA